MNVFGEVRKRDYDRCRNCGHHPAEVHHILFKSQGGPDEAWNLICLCQTCHGHAHGLKEPRLPRWLLHMTVWLGGVGSNTASVKQVQQRLRKDSPRYQICMSCDRYGDSGWCAIWEDYFAWNYGCSAWKLRGLE